jgi:hypothetical protein
MPIELSGDDKDIIEYLQGELAAAQVELQAATTPETKRNAVEHLHQMLDDLVLLLCVEETQQTPTLRSHSR